VNTIERFVHGADVALCRCGSRGVFRVSGHPPFCLGALFSAMLTIAVLMVELLISCLSFIFENIKCRENVRPPARCEDKEGLGEGLSTPQPLKLAPHPKHDGRSSATYELPQNIYSAIQILIMSYAQLCFLYPYTRSTCTQLWFVVY